MEKSYILDTNILVLAVRESPIWEKVKIEYALNTQNIAISIVSKAEILSLANQFGWGKSKLASLAILLEKLIIVPVDSDALIEAYIEIDLYSQKALTDVTYPASFTPRNMGKNDLWIAATVYSTNSTLLSTDKDFEHLKDIFIDFQYISLEKED